MDINDFYRQIYSEINSEYDDATANNAYDYKENIFTSVFLQHMVDSGITSNPTQCECNVTVKNSKVKLSAYSLDDDAENLELFTSYFIDSESLESIPLSEIKNISHRAWSFFQYSLDGTLLSRIEQSSQAYQLASVLQHSYTNIDRIVIYVITNGQSNKNFFEVREINGKSVKIEVFDINRLYKNAVEGKTREEIVVDFGKTTGAPLPCVYVPDRTGKSDSYDYALTVFPGKTLYSLYDKYGPRLLEANVRSFLQSKGKVNAGIKNTLVSRPDRFMAYNNGLVLVADEINVEKVEDGYAIQWVKGLQIVNGGQTTASIFFDKKKNPDIDLSLVSVPAKIIIVNKNSSEEDTENLISLVAQYANSQNVVRAADLSSNKKFHVEFEKIVNSLWCGEGDRDQWFYERTTGSYNVMLNREASTKAQLRNIKTRIPLSRKITKVDLAKYLMSWDKKLCKTALGRQKNYVAFMEEIEKLERDQQFKPDEKWVKESIAKAIIFKQADKIVNRLKTTSKSVITNYLVAYLSFRIGDKISLKLIWNKQDISDELKNLLFDWGQKVNEVISSAANSKSTLITEWAKKDACWEDVKQISVDLPNAEEIPEMKSFLKENSLL